MNSSDTRRWWQPGPFEYSSSTMLLMRLGFAMLIFWSTEWGTGKLTTQDNPNGIAHFVDLTWLGHHPPGWGIKGLCIGGLLMYVVGFLPVLGLLPMLFFSICIGTLNLSQGEIQHSWQLVTLIGLAQFAAYAALGRAALRPSRDVQRLAASWGTVTIAGGYVTCGLVKMVATKGLWIWKTPLLSVQLLKSNWAAYYNWLKKPPHWLEQFTQFLVDHPWFTRAFFGTGLVLELFAFTVLISRRWAFWFGLALVSLHVGISFVMGLKFPEHNAAIAIFLILPNAIAALRRGPAKNAAALP